MIVVITGPTGVGKTKMSIELAKKLDAYIINADAVQIYEGLNIGSAKVTKDEMTGIKHFLLDIRKPNEEYTVKDYQEDLRKLLALYKNKNIIIVGGTGLYICAGLMDYRFLEDEETKSYDEYSTEELYQMALVKDKNMPIDKNNRVRLIRFLNKNVAEKVEPKLLYDNVYFIGLTTNRENLYKIIDKRVDEMLEIGLINEVKELYTKYPDSKILKRAIGYKEIIEYLNGNISFSDAKDLIKKNSRHYAKRQYTWFNNKMDITWFNVNYDNFNATIKEVSDFLNI